VTFKGELYPFQEKAKTSMLERGSFLLAFTMGLGKTPTSIAVAEELIDTGEVQTCLVVCPASIKWQWARQLKKFTDGALVKVIEGPPQYRRGQYRAVKRGDVEYVIMNYEQIVNDWDVIRFLPWDLVIGDEITAIKSPGAKRSRRMKRLNWVPYRFGLTGQPIENKPEEAFSIMELLDPTVFGAADVFEKSHIQRRPNGSVRYYRNLPRFHRTMSDVMDRKTRKDVKDQLPAVIAPPPILVDFDRQGARLYNQIADDLGQMLARMPKGSTFNVWDHYAGLNAMGEAQGAVMARLCALRMLCDHPMLLRYSADQFDDPDAQAGSAYASTLQKTGVLTSLNSAPKLRELMFQIGEILNEDPNNKIVVFSFFKPMLRLIAQQMPVGTYGMFTGDVSPRQRDAVLQNFERSPYMRVLLSSDAGGVGVDLPFANYLISVDLPWSAGKWEQRMGRIIRLSSTWPEVTLLSVLMRGSIEERMYEMLEEKMAISAAFMDGTGVNEQGEFHLGLSTLGDFLAAHVA
jgi:SNF2 family DNA or RNA helicase